MRMMIGGLDRNGTVAITHNHSRRQMNSPVEIVLAVIKTHYGLTGPNR